MCRFFKGYLSLLFLLVFSSIALADPANEELQKFLDLSAEQTRLQIEKNDILVQQGRASEGIYFNDARAQYNGVEMMTPDIINRFNQNLATYQNEVQVVNMPLLAEDALGKTEVLRQAQMYSQRYANKIDMGGNMTVLLIWTALDKAAQSMYTFPVLLAGTKANSTYTTEIKVRLENISCKQYTCYSPDLVKDLANSLGNQNFITVYYTYGELQSHLSNNHLFFIAPSGKLFAIDMFALNEKYKTQQPLYAFHLKFCKDSSYCYALQ